MAFLVGETNDPFSPPRRMLACYSALTSKAWEAMISKDDLWRLLLSMADSMTVLSGDQLQDVFHHYRAIVQEHALLRDIQNLNSVEPELLGTK